MAGPKEPPTGQDDPPDVRQAVLVVLLLLADVRDKLRRIDDPQADELLVRIGAVVAVLRRIRDRLGGL